MSTPQLTSEMQTLSGQYFDFRHPEDYHYDIEEIAVALAGEGRFGNHVKPVYSVAQHSVLVSHIVAPEFAFEGLIHDVAEAYIGDWPTPLKKLFPEIKALEMRIHLAICSQFGWPSEIPPEVKHADYVALATERVNLLKYNEGDPQWSFLDEMRIKPLTSKLTAWPAEVAEVAFLNRYATLTRRLEYL